MSVIPTGTMTRALTDKERKAVKAEALRLHRMLDDDRMYWRQGLTPPPPKPKPRPYTTVDLRRERPDLWERTLLPKGDLQRLTLPQAKREAQKRNLLPPGFHHWDADGKPCSADKAHTTCIVGGVDALWELAHSVRGAAR
jgi:hypothetical protein